MPELHDPRTDGEEMGERRGTGADPPATGLVHLGAFGLFFAVFQ